MRQADAVGDDVQDDSDDEHAGHEDDYVVVNHDVGGGDYDHGGEDDHDSDHDVVGGRDHDDADNDVGGGDGHGNVVEDDG